MTERVYFCSNCGYPILRTFSTRSDAHAYAERQAAETETMHIVCYKKVSPQEASHYFVVKEGDATREEWGKHVESVWPNTWWDGDLILPKAALRFRQLTQKQVAAEMGIARGHLSRVLNGREPWTPSLRERFAKAIGIAEDGISFDPEEELE